MSRAKSGMFQGHFAYPGPPPRPDGALSMFTSL